MTTENPVSPMDSPRRLRLLQAAVLAGAAVAAVLIARSGPGKPAPIAEPPAPAFQMLAYLDARVSTQESRKDVRCWSSFNKLQMFITHCEISEDAKAERIRQHMELIQSLYDAAEGQANGAGLIPADAVQAMLDQRFPKVDTAEGTRFEIGGITPTLVGKEALKDYSDTIEPWRLMQAWAHGQLDARGIWSLPAQFDEPALLVLYRFFRAFDLAMLQRARDHALDRKLSRIDAEAVAAAFQDRSRKKD
jgi:hypothetical protein